MNDTPKKTDQRRGWARLLLFLLLLVPFIFFANRFLLKTDTVYYYSMLEMTHRDDIDIAFVGSSVVTYNFDPQIISEQTGRVAYNAGIGSIGVPSSVEVAKQLFRTNHPELVVLVIDPQSLLIPDEDIQAQIRILPFIRNPLERLAYTLELSAQDGKFLDRLLLFKLQPITSFEDFTRNVELFFDPAGYAERHNLLWNGPLAYRGHGHVHVNRSLDRGTLLQSMSIRPYIACEDQNLFPYAKKKLLEFKELCEEQGTQLLVMFAPDLTVYRLAVYGYVQKYESVARLCRENGIDFCDFTLARPEFLPVLDDYYYDIYHLNGEGAQRFSRKLSEYLNLYLAGEPVDHLFYASQQEALEHIDFITNVWVNDTIEDGTLTLAADCNRGPNVTPEYRFALAACDGSETLLQDYSEEGLLSLALGDMPEDSRIVVYARPNDDPQKEPVRCSYRPQSTR